MHLFIYSLEENMKARQPQAKIFSCEQTQVVPPLLW